jgi:AraC-like DNA-binding protein
LYKLMQARQISLEQWIIERRLAGAHAELATPGAGDRPIATIARAWGFTSASHFTTRFRRRYGLTPREQRLAARSEGGWTGPKPLPRLEDGADDAAVRAERRAVDGPGAGAADEGHHVGDLVRVDQPGQQ